MASVGGSPRFGKSAQLLSLYGCGVGTKHLTPGEVVFMDRRVYGVVLEGSDDVEAGLFEAQGETAGAGEQVNGYGPSARSSTPFRPASLRLPGGHRPG